MTGNSEKPASKGSIYALIVLAFCLLLFTGLDAWFANYRAVEVGKQWCDLIVTVNDGFKAAPPSQQSGKVLATEFRDLQQRLDCPR